MRLSQERTKPGTKRALLPALSAITLSMSILKILELLTVCEMCVGKSFFKLFVAVGLSFLIRNRVGLHTFG